MVQREEGNAGVNATGKKRITYSLEFLLAVGSSEDCKALPAGVNMSKHPDDVKLWLLEAASRIFLQFHHKPGYILVQLLINVIFSSCSTAGCRFASPASFGASATAKISVDASFACVIIGTGGATIKQISRVSGAKLCIRDHDSDAGLKNVELEGTFDQIKNASEMVMEKLSRFGLGGFAPPPAGDKNLAGGSVRGRGQSDSFKTRLCGHFARGCCTHGDGCRFAHGDKELRKPVYAAREPGGW
ncbi:hypothetical protein ACQ4PT_054156 [Festuca glaucescens]